MHPITLLAIVLVLAPVRVPFESGSQESRTACKSLDFLEFAIDTGVARLRVAQSRASAASDSTGFVVVWQDDRGSSGADIYADRITLSGGMLDTDGIAICTAPNKQWEPTISRLDSIYLIVWYDRRGDGNGDVYGARLTRSGRVLDPSGIPICDARGAQEYPVVAAADTAWFVVWQDNRTEWNIRGTCVSASGMVQAPGGFAIGNTTGQQLYPSVAFNQEDFLVVWQSDQYGPWTLWGARVSTTGEVRDPAGFLVAGDISQGMEPNAPSVASASADFLVTWHNARTPRRIFATRVSGDGYPKEPTIVFPNTGVTQHEPSVASDDTGYFVCWQESRSGTWEDVYGVRVSADGVVADTAAIPLATETDDQYEPAVTGGKRWLFVWTDEAPDAFLAVVHGTCINKAGEPLGPEFQAGSFAPFYASQSMPAVAASNDGYVAAWEDGAPIHGSGVNHFSTHCGMLDADGHMSDVPPITMPKVTPDSHPPVVACGDSNWMVVRSWNGIRAARIGFDGTLLDPSWILVSSADVTPAVAFDGSNYLIVWAESRNIYGSRVSQSGQVLDRISISLESTNELDPSVAFDGTNYLVVWQNGDRAWGTRVTPTGVVIDTGGFAINPPGCFGRSLAATFGGSAYLVVWYDQDGQIKGARIGPDGTVLDAVPIALSDWEGYYGYDYYPSVSFDGSNYIVSWLAEDYYNALGWGINGAVVSPTGARIDTFRVSTRARREQGPVSAGGTDGRVLVIYPAVLDPNGGGRDTLPRVWGSFVSSTGFVAESHGLTSGRTSFAASPNPFSRKTLLRFGHEQQSADAQVNICDAAGRTVRELNARGHAAVKWDGTDNRSLLLPRGVYFCTLRTGTAAARLKLVKLD